MKFVGGVRGCPVNIFSLQHFLFSNRSLAMVLGSVNFPAEVRCTTIFALRNGKFSSRLGATHPHIPLKFLPCSVPLLLCFLMKQSINIHFRLFLYNLKLKIRQA